MHAVVLGGAGNFGARIVRALREDPGLRLTSAGRRAVPVPGAAEVATAVLDIGSADFPQRLKDLAPDLVIHCVGPFQGQGYHVAMAALEAGANYLDLADGRDFVAGFPEAVHAMASSHGLVAISGASTLPALSTAVIESLRTELVCLESIRIVIAPGQLAPRGAATMAAVFSYLGGPVRVWREGRWQTGWGWMDLRKVDLGFGKRWGALCDVADLALLPARYPQVRTVTFHAALEVRLQHLVLWMLAAVRRLGLPMPVENWAASLDRMAGMFDASGGEWGGMQVQVAGLDVQGARRRRTWTLQAPAVHGPEIPCMTAILLARHLARGEPLPAGAHPCVGFVALEDFTPQFARWGITTHIKECALPAQAQW